MQPSPREIYPLTSLRFFAASLVVLEHLQMLPGLEWLGLKNDFLGIAGVRIFFVLSGFIISYTYWGHDWSLEFGRHTRGFYWSRFARIYPLHWLMFLLALPLGLNSNTSRVSVTDFPWLLSLTYKLWPGFTAGPQPVKAAWTLSCEILFYLATPLIFTVLTRQRNPVIASSMLCLVFTGAILALATTFPSLNWSAYLEMPHFLLGIVGFHLSQRVDLSRSANALMLVGTLLLVGAGTISSPWLRPEFLHLLYAPGALMVILGCATVSGRVGGFLSWPFLVLLGHASYALYLFHDPALRYLKVALNRNGTILPFPLSMAVAILVFGLLVAAAIVCFKVYESPARLKLRAWFKQKPRPANSTEAVDKHARM